MSNRDIVTDLSAIACITLALVRTSAASSDHASSEEDASTNDYFSTPVFLLLLREALEAFVIISVLLQYLKRTQRQQLNHYVYAGAIAGLVLSLTIGGALVALYYTVGKNYMSEKAEEIFEGAMMLVGACIIAYFGANTLHMFNTKYRFNNLVERMNGVANNKDRWQIALISFTTVIREGLESVLLLSGVTSSYPPSALPISASAGITTAFGMGLLLHASGSFVPNRWFIRFATALLFAISAGLAAHGIHELQEAQVLGNYESTNDPWWNQTIWDISGCCSDKNNVFFSLMRAVFGYQDKPTAAEIIAYLTTWLTAGSLALHKNLKYQDQLLKEKEAELDAPSLSVHISPQSPAAITLPGFQQHCQHVQTPLKNGEDSLDKPEQGKPGQLYSVGPSVAG